VFYQIILISLHKMTFLERADQRFLWNHHLLREFSGYRELANLCVPLIHGFVSIQNCTVNGQNFTWAIISRRSNQRVGARLVPVYYFTIMGEWCNAVYYGVTILGYVKGPIKIIKLLFRTIVPLTFLPPIVQAPECSSR